ncbi:MAG: NUDIX domain-containing protein [Simkaniaceae bacterium]|nr:NUDIX domain-containing protein [Simkaniaceae bacterium]
MTATKFAQSEKQRFKMKEGVFLVLISEGRVLLIRRYNTGIADGCHVLPMGGVDKNETAIEALIREAKEEVNITVQSHSVDLVHTLHRMHHLPHGDSFKQIDLFFRPKHFSGKIINMEPHKCDEVAFYPLNALPETTETFISQALNNIQLGIPYSEFGFEMAPKKQPTIN